MRKKNLFSISLSFTWNEVSRFSIVRLGIELRDTISRESRIHVEEEEGWKSLLFTRPGWDPLFFRYKRGQRVERVEAARRGESIVPLQDRAKDIASQKFHEVTLQTPEWIELRREEGCFHSCSLASNLRIGNKSIDYRAFIFPLSFHCNEKIGWLIIDLLDFWIYDFFNILIF